MEKLNSTLYLILGCLPVSAQRYTGYGRGIDNYGDRGGFFLVTGDDAIFGIFMLAICAVIAFICYKIAETIDKNEESKGAKHTFTTILYIVASIAMIAAIGFAFALWWIVLIIVIIIAIYGGIREKIEGEKQQKKQQIVNPKKNQETSEDTPKTKHSTIINEWSLISFVREHGGKLQVGNFKNNNEELFKACIVSNNGENKIFVCFHSQLGELTPQEIKEKKHYLFVGQTVSGNYFLYTKNK